jgi:cytoskeletal protein CcmA (bactofilin family)
MSDGNAHTTVIGADAVFCGEMTFKGSARVLGGFEGRITSKGELQIADEAACKATIEVGRLHLEGSIEGDVTASERLELTASARLKGNVVAARLAVAEGATLIGHVTVGTQSAFQESEPAVAAAIEAKPGAAQNRNSGAGAGQQNGRADQRQDFRADHRAEAAGRR